MNRVFSFRQPIGRFVLGMLILFLSSGALADSQKKVFTLRLSGEPETLDWNRAHTPIEGNLLSNLMDGLVAFDPQLKVIPALAQSWKVSSDGKVYEFHLRKDVQWSDGVALRAQDFVFSWKRLLSPETAAAYAYFLYDVVGAEAFNRGELKDFNQVGIQALDDHTLQVTLSRPTAYWISIPTFWVTFPLREDVVKKEGSRWTEPGKMVTLGPFTLASWQHDSKVILKANPTYRHPGVRSENSANSNAKSGSKPEANPTSLEQIVALIVQDNSTAMNLYQSGQIDFLADIPWAETMRWEGKPDLRKFPYLKTVYLGFVVDRPSVSDVKLRKAIAKALDKTKLGQLLSGESEPANSWVPPLMLGYSKRIGLAFGRDSVEHQVKQHAIKAGPIELLVPNREQSVLVGQFIQAELQKNLGLTVSLQPFDNKTYRAKMDQKSYPMFIASWSADYPDPDNFLSVFLSSSGNNRTKWSNKTYDAGITKARHLQNTKERESIYFQLQKLLLEQEVVLVPLYYNSNWALVNTRVENLEVNPLNYLNLRNVKFSGN